MKTDNLNFDKFTHEAHDYFNALAKKMGYPEERNRAMIAWRAVMHTLRDRIHIAESFDMMSQLPLILTAMYVEGWKYHEKPPLEYQSVRELNKRIEKLQAAYGEAEFDWDLSTDEIASRVIESLKRYLSEGQLQHIRGQLPEGVKHIVIPA